MRDHDRVRLQIRITTTDPRSWEAVLGERPADVRLEPRGGELALFGASAATTGIRLVRDGTGFVIAVPAFASLDELSLARGLSAQIATLTRGTISVSGQTLPHDQFATAFDDQIATQFLKACIDQFGRMLEAPAGTVFAIDGVHRPYYLGRTSAARIAKLADGDVYTKTASIVEALQQIGAPTLLPAQLTIRTPDGETARYAVWNPRHETLLPPCDYVLIRESATTKIRVPHARIADVVASDEPGVAHGAPIDEIQWLLGALDDATAEQLTARASTMGRRLKLADA